jgi:PKD repeat protein
MNNLKTLLLAIAISTLSIGSFAQQNLPTNPPDTADYPYWIEMMQDQSINFYDVQKAFNTYWQDRKVTKGSGWMPYKRWEWWTGQHIYPDGSRHEADKVYKAYNQYLNEHPNAKSTNGEWENLGPFNLPGGEKGYKGLGRINAIAFHPSDPNIVFIGAPAGGFWKYDSGTWTGTTDVLPTLGVSSIVVDWQNPDNIYIGTGDRDAGDAVGMGVFKSTDGGQTWLQWNTGMGNTIVGRMLQHPTNPDLIYAATGSGIFKTTDAGANWEQIKTGGSKDIVFKPGNTNILYAVQGSSFYKSTDAGDNWEHITNGLVSGQRAAIAVTPANPEVVYFIQTQNSAFKGLYRSTNSGESFTEQSTSPNIMSWGCNGGDGGQAWYDLDIAADPNDENTIFAGGVNCFKSSNGGITWNISSHWWGDCGVPSVHADMHVLEYNPLNDRLYAGNDGGVYYSPNGGSSWPEITSGLPIGQVYRIGQCKITKDNVINGYQDNGTSTYYGNNNWQFTNGGDGMECAFDHTDDTYSYATVYYGSIVRKHNNSEAHQVGGEGVHGISESGGWITPFCLHESNSNVMFAGYKNIWRADNVKSYSFTWKKLTDFGSNNINVVEHCPVDNDLFYWSVNGSLYRSDNVMSDSPQWLNLSEYIPGNETIRDIECSTSDENTVYVSRGSKVLKSEDRGMNWVDISGTLPNINMNSIASSPNSFEGIYVASDAGIYYRDASLDDWVMFSNGLPVDASVNEIEIYHNPADPSEDAIRAGTYGRGLWSSTLWQGTLNANFEASQTIAPTECGIDFFDLSSGIPTSWEWTFQGGTPSTSTEKNPVGIVYSSTGTFNVSLTVNNAEGSDSHTINGYITISDSEVPEVIFYASDSITCIGNATTLVDESTNCPSSWEWDISPGTFSFLNGTNQFSQEPEISFEETGIYTISLTVTNSAGTGELTKENYISAGGTVLPFSDDFESGNLNTKAWTVENPDLNITWEMSDVGGNTPGDKAASINFHDYTLVYARDRLITPLLNFEGFDQVYLSFQHAYAQRYSSATDSLVIYLSNDCGSNWMRITGYGEDGDGSFGTHEIISGQFIPEVEEDWCGVGWGAPCNLIDLSAWAGQNDIQIAFESYNYYGTALYIDNVMVGPLTDISESNPGFDEIQVFPNPSSGVFNLWIPSGDKPDKISVYNMQGTETLNLPVKTSEEGENIQLDLSGFTKGVYFIRINTNTETIVKKIIRN